MTKQQAEQLDEKDPNVIEDLTLAATETANINGGGIGSDYILGSIQGVDGESNNRPRR